MLKASCSGTKLNPHQNFDPFTDRLLYCCVWSKNDHEQNRRIIFNQGKDRYAGIAS